MTVNHVSLGQSYDANDNYIGTGATGWTTITPSVGDGASGKYTNIIYLSDSTGSDSYDGSSPTFISGTTGPLKRTIAAMAPRSSTLNASIDDGSTVTFTCTAANATTAAIYGNWQVTSATSKTIGTGIVSFTDITGSFTSAINLGQTVAIANGSNYMLGVIRYYSGVNLTVEVTSVVGSGTFSAWNIGPIFTVNSTITGATSLSTARTAYPTATGTLTKVSGTGDATITYSAFATTAGTVLTITYDNGGACCIGQTLTGGGISGSCIVTETNTENSARTGYGRGSGVGNYFSDGTYTVSSSQHVNPVTGITGTLPAIGTLAKCVFTGTLDGTGTVLTVTAVASGSFCTGQTLNNGGTITETHAENATRTGAGNTGTYTVSGGTPNSSPTSATLSSAALRTGYPDWLLFKKGDTWLNQTITKDCQNTERTGTSATELMVIASYGTSVSFANPRGTGTGARPLFNITSMNKQLNDINSGGNIIGAMGGGNHAALDYMAVIGLEFYSSVHDPLSGDYTSSDKHSAFIPVCNLEALHWLLLEDCSAHSFAGYDLEGINGTLYLRRNIVYNMWQDNAIGSKPQGFYINWDTTSTSATLVMEENVLDQNGWCPQELATAPRSNQFCHGAYLQANNTQPTVTKCYGNIATRNCSIGIKQWTGGESIDNLFSLNAIGQQFGNATNPPLGVTNIIKNNIVVEAIGYSDDNITAGDTSWGYQLYDCVNPTTFYNNLIIHNVGATNVAGLIIDAGATGVTATNDIICDCPSPLTDNNGTNTTIPNVTNAGTCSINSYPDPLRIVGKRSAGTDLTFNTYDAAILNGDGTFNNFISLALAQNKDTWDERITANAINNWIREGFGIGGGGTAGSGSAPSMGNQYGLYKTKRTKIPHV